jgi:hypothetical protein
LYSIPLFETIMSSANSPEASSPATAYRDAGPPSSSSPPIYTSCPSFTSPGMTDVTYYSPHVERDGRMTMKATRTTAVRTPPNPSCSKAYTPPPKGGVFLNEIKDYTRYIHVTKFPGQEKEVLAEASDYLKVFEEAMKLVSTRIPERSSCLSHPWFALLSCLNLIGCLAATASCHLRLRPLRHCQNAYPWIASPSHL